MSIPENESNVNKEVKYTYKITEIHNVRELHHILYAQCNYLVNPIFGKQA